MLVLFASPVGRAAVASEVEEDDSAHVVDAAALVRHAALGERPRARSLRPRRRRRHHRHRPRPPQAPHLQRAPRPRPVTPRRVLYSDDGDHGGDDDDDG